MISRGKGCAVRNAPCSRPTGYWCCWMTPRVKAWKTAACSTNCRRPFPTPWCPIKKTCPAAPPARAHTLQAQQQLQQKRGELAAEELRLAQQTLGEVTGEFTSDDLLGRIFASFCIGK